MKSERDEIREKRRRLKDEYGLLFDEMAAMLFRHDPIGINFESNTDEYEPEVGTILPRLNACKSVENVGDVVYEEFVRWFGEAGTRPDYQEIASEIWKMWRRNKLPPL